MVNKGRGLIREKWKGIIPASILERSKREFTSSIKRLLSSETIPMSFCCFSLSVPPTPSNRRLVPSRIEVRGVLNFMGHDGKEVGFHFVDFVQLRAHVVKGLVEPGHFRGDWIFKSPG